MIGFSREVVTAPSLLKFKEAFGQCCHTNGLIIGWSRADLGVGFDDLCRSLPIFRILGFYDSKVHLAKVKAPLSRWRKNVVLKRCYDLEFAFTRVFATYLLTSPNLPAK